MSDRLKKNFLMSREVHEAQKDSSSELYVFSEEDSFALPSTEKNQDSPTSLALEKNKFSNFLEIVIAIGHVLSDKTAMDDALKQILSYAQNITHADAGTIYLTNGDRRSLSFKLIVNRTLNISVCTPSQPDLKLCTSDVPLYDELSGEPHMKFVASQCFHKNATIVVSDAYYDRNFDFSGTRKFDELNGYRSKSFLTVPLRNRQNEVIGIFQLINAKDPKTNRSISFKKDHYKVIEALASLASIALCK